MFIWPDLVPGPLHCFNKNCLTNLSKLPPQPITRIWEFHFSIPPWILEAFGITPGIFLEVEFFLCRDDPDREENSIVITIWLNRVVDLNNSDQPNTVELITLNFRFSWPNQYHVPDEEYHRNLAPSTVSKGSSDTFANTNWSPGSPVPQYNSLSPCPPCFQSAEEEQQNQNIEITPLKIINWVNERIDWACSIAEELVQTIYWVHQSQGTEFNQTAFREGGLTYCQLQQIDQINNPNLYSDTTDTAVVGPSTQFQEDEQYQEGEEQEEHLEEQPLPHPLHIQEQMQQEDLSSKTQNSQESSKILTRPSTPIKQTLIVPFLTEEDWTLWLNKQLDRVFQ